MRLSENFTLSELTKSQTAERFGLSNEPTPEVIDNLKELVVNVLQPIRQHYNKPVVVSSGYRSVEVNSAIRGAKNSDHVKGMAADIEIHGVSNYEVAKWIESNLQFRQLILEFYTLGVPNSGWVHVSYDRNDLKKQSLTAYRTETGIVYRNGLIE